jgi:hypothetical protein
VIEYLLANPPEPLMCPILWEAINSEDPEKGLWIDGLYMNDPSLTLVFLMQSFHERLNELISKSAIVVPGYRLAFLSRLAFGQNEQKYRVFYNDRDEARCWLSQYADIAK